MLFIDLRHATGIKPLLAATATALAPQELFLSLALTRKGGQSVQGAAWGLRSRAVLADEDKEKVKWNERYVADLPKGNEHVSSDAWAAYLVSCSVSDADMDGCIVSLTPALPGMWSTLSDAF